MEKDWSARFYPERRGTLKPGCLILITLPFFVFCVLWAIFTLLTGFEDSMGNPRNSDLLGHIGVYSIALFPFLLLVLPALIIYKECRLRKSGK